MRLTVKFHGLCLFTTNDRNHAGPFTVLLPDARAARSMKDGTTADPHNAAILEDVPGTKEKVLRRFDDTRVSFRALGAPGSAAPGRKLGIASVPDLRRFAADIEIDRRARPIAQVMLDVPGAVSTDDEAPGLNRAWSFGEALKPGHGHGMPRVAEAVVYTVDYPDGVRVMIEDGSGTPPLDFTTNTTLHIVNICDDVTDVTTRRARPTKPGDTVPDQDFKWFYELLVSTAGGTLEDRTQGQGRTLPVPTAESLSVKSRDRAPDTPTCLCGFFCEVPDCPNH